MIRRKGGLRLVESHENVEISRVDSIDDRLKDLLRCACRHVNLQGGALFTTRYKTGCGRRWGYLRLAAAGSFTDATTNLEERPAFDVNSR